MLRKFKERLLNFLADSAWFNVVFVARVQDEDTELWYDCIYCSILRTAVIFFVLGVLLGALIW